jgi:arginase
MALGYIGNNTPIHLSFSIDALDSMWAPSTKTPTRGGLTLREGNFIAECIHETSCLVAMDLVEVNPTLELGISDISTQQIVRSGCSLVRCALGERLL